MYVCVHVYISVCVKAEHGSHAIHINASCVCVCVRLCKAYTSKLHTEPCVPLYVPAIFIIFIVYRAGYCMSLSRQPSLAASQCLYCLCDVFCACAFAC